MSIKQWMASLSLLLASSVLYAGVGPDELVKKTAEDVIAVVKSDKDIQAGNQDKIFKLAEEKNSA